MARINVIIPFYQREPGILPVAVKSVFAQGDDELLVTVIDDGSPVSARTELSELLMDGFPIVIVEQANAGPGAARNHGLDETPADVEYIAFLDSDDRWLPGHLENARTAFRHGADFYFADADHHERGMTHSRFSECDFGSSLCTALDDGDNLFLYHGSIFDAILRSSPVGTSTVVLRRSINAFRFPTGLIFGEDKFLWMCLASRARQVVFSTRCEAVYGRGVNIYAGATWGTPQALKRMFHTAVIHQSIARHFHLNEEQRCWNDEWLSEVRRTFAANLLHLINHRKSIDWRTVASYAARNPCLAGDILRQVFARGRRRLRGTDQ